MGMRAYYIVLIFSMPRPLALYIHWPFCKAKCPYCDFNSHVRESVEHARWQKALLREMEYFASLTSDCFVATVFFGGGTPSLMETTTVEALLEHAQQLWGFTDDVEITLEANPTSVEAQRFADFKAAGVNRLSMGIQALNDVDLQFLGRQHSVNEALAAFKVARKTFGRTSFDLIYARPGQTVEAWEGELQRALTYADGHLSLYQLTLEPGTAMYSAHARGDFVMIDEDVAADMYDQTQLMMAEARYDDYEVSNYAHPGDACRHNLAYWRSEDYVGIGPGAHGRITKDQGIEITSPGKRVAVHTLRSPEKWLAAVECKGHGIEVQTSLSDREVLEEVLLMGLRLTEGITEEHFRALTGMDFPSSLSTVMIDQLQHEGLLVCNDVLRVTSKGRLLLNTVTAQLLQ